MATPLLPPPDTIKFDFAESQVCIPLRNDFKFRHEPTRSDGGAHFVGRQQEINDLTARIRFSEGGAFLITGYRGVGKTSFINQVLRQLRTILDVPNRRLTTGLVDIYMSLPSRIQPVDLMHNLVRRLYERLEELGILQQLDSTLRDRLLLAYRRTSVNVTQRSTQNREFGLGPEAGWTLPFGTLKSALNFKHSNSLSSDSAYIAYDERSAEHDLIQLARSLTLGYPAHRNPMQRLLRQPIPRVALKIVFVFDELDKLDPAEAGQENVAGKIAEGSIDSILRSLKTLLTTSGVSFIFIAGKELYDRWIEDVGKGDSVYESIFAYDKYLPCLWYDAKAFAGHLVDLAPFNFEPCDKCKQDSDYARVRTEPPLWLESPPRKPNDPDLFCSQCGKYLRDPKQARSAYEAFLAFLAFRGRGIPRRIWRAFDRSVKWYNSRPVLAFSAADLKQHRVYAELWALLNQADRELLTPDVAEPGLSMDGLRLAVFYLADLILRRNSSLFTQDDIITAAKSVSAKIMPLPEVANLLIGRLLRIMVKGGFLEEVTRKANPFRRVVVDADHVKVDQVESSALRRYRIDPRRLHDLGNDTSELPEDVGIAKETPESKCGPYRLLNLIGAGGMARVYRATHPVSGNEVAVKVLDRAAAFEADLRVRFLREASLMESIAHPNIVRYLDSGEDGGKLYIVMELLEGTELEQVLSVLQQLPAPEALGIIEPVAEALEYLHARDLVRNDIKPSNIILSSTSRVCLIDLGTSKTFHLSENLTSAGVIVGTPDYMAPEQIKGEAIDRRCDIYSLGAVLYRMLTGRKVFTDTSIEGLLYAVLTKEPERPKQWCPSIPDELEKLILSCLEKKPEGRPQDVATFLARLRATGVMPLRNIAALVKDSKRTKDTTDRAAGAITAAFNKDAPGEFTQMFGPSHPMSPVPPPTTRPPQPTTIFSGVTGTFQSPSVPRPYSQGPSNFTLMLGPVGAAAVRRVPMGELTLMFAKPMALHLIIADPPERRGEKIQINSARFKIGRGTENDLSLGAESISRFHAEISRDTSGFWVEDLHSSTGTKLNARPVNGQFPIRDGDILEIAEFKFRVSLSPVAASASRGNTAET